MNLRGVARRGRHVWVPPLERTAPRDPEPDPEPECDPAMRALIAALTAPQTR